MDLKPVQALIVDTDTGEEPETIHLVRAGGRWLID